MALQTSFPHTGLFNFFDEEATDGNIRLRFWTDSVGDGTGTPDTVLSSLNMTGKEVSWISPPNDSTETITGNLNTNDNTVTPEYDGNEGSPVTVWWMTVEYDYDNDATYEVIDTAKHQNGGQELKTNQKLEVTGHTMEQGEPSSDTLDPSEPDPTTGAHPNDALTGIIHDAVTSEDDNVQGYTDLRIIYVTDDGTSSGYRKNKDIALSSFGTGNFSIDNRGMITLTGGVSTEVTYDSGDGQGGNRLQQVLLALWDGTTERIFAAAKDVKDTDGNNVFIDTPQDIQLNQFKYIL